MTKMNVRPSTPDPIIVTGAPGSSEWLAWVALGALGVWGTRAAKGGKVDLFWSNSTILHELVKPFFLGMGFHHMGAGTETSLVGRCQSMDEKIARAWRRKCLSIIWDQGYSGGPWLYAGPEALLAWPIIRQAFPDARWVVVRKDKGVLLKRLREQASFLQKDTRMGDPLKWVRLYESRIDQVKRVEKVQEFWPNRVFSKGDMVHIRDMAKFLSLPWDQDKVADAMIQPLWHAGQFDVHESIREEARR